MARWPRILGCSARPSLVKLDAMAGRQEAAVNQAGPPVV
jgi:hypothetical protein